jgi:hypothetical protein
MLFTSAHIQHKIMHKEGLLCRKDQSTGASNRIEGIYTSDFQIDDSELENIVQLNTEWIRLTHGLLHYYGVMEVCLVKKKIEELTGEKIDFLEFMKVMSFACDFYGQVRCTSYGYQDDRVFEAKKIVEEHRKRPGVDYYPFTKTQLLKASDPDYVDITPEMNSFISFLLKYYKLSDE